MQEIRMYIKKRDSEKWLSLLTNNSLFPARQRKLLTWIIVLNKHKMLVEILRRGALQLVSDKLCLFAYFNYIAPHAACRVHQVCE